MGRGVNSQNESVTNYIFNNANTFHLAESCIQSPGLSCKSVHGQNKIIDLETTMWKGKESHAVVNPSLPSVEGASSVPPPKQHLPFAAGQWTLRESKSAKTISTVSNDRWVDSMPSHHPLAQNRVNASSIELYGVDTRQLIKYN